MKEGKGYKNWSLLLAWDFVDYVSPDSGFWTVADAHKLKVAMAAKEKSSYGHQLMVMAPPRAPPGKVAPLSTWKDLVPAIREPDETLVIGFV